MKTGWLIGLAAAVLVGASARPAAAQSCDDFDPCTVQDMCSDGMCSGTPTTNGSCDDGDDCTVNDRCSAEGCTGDPAPLNTSCGGGCGTCQSISPIPIPGLPLFCVGKAEDNGKSCDFGTPCLDGTCSITAIPGAPAVAFCFPQQKVCPDTDGNPCTDGCNFNTGRCEKDVPKCIPTCETCNRNTGVCEAANEGAPCDDFNECTGKSRCEPTDLGGTIRGLCVEGDPTGPTPTATQPSGPTPTATNPPSFACVGDCNDDGEVAVNEIISGVNIALGNSAVSTCPSFDANEDDSVAVNELISGVNALLNGCS
ncbi:MAG: hypothetical protein SF182_12005 [Deltaproteobacteria bacterium]|nr:hypothetical protein [Deltaproteobacteria bacterium]